MGLDLDDVITVIPPVLDMFLDDTVISYRQKKIIEDAALAAVLNATCNSCNAHRIVPQNTNHPVVDVFFMFLKGKAEYLQKGNFW